MAVSRSPRSLLHGRHNSYRIAFGFLAIFLVSPLSALAHGAGAFYETQVGDYIVDVGFSNPAPALGESVIFDFQLRGSDTTLTQGSDTDFSNTWVRIEGEDSTVFASGIHNAEFGGPRMSYVFPKEGAYTIHVRYESGDTSLAEASFPMTVTPSASNSLLDQIPYTEGVLGLCVGILGMLLVPFLRRKNKSR